MGIASFSPQLGRATGLSMLLVPVQALVALFVPNHTGLAHTRQAASRTLACRTAASSRTGIDASFTKVTQTAVPAVPVQRLKIVRQFEPGANRSCAGRLVISGRMSDVCAELDRMAG